MFEEPLERIKENTADEEFYSIAEDGASEVKEISPEEIKRNNMIRMVQEYNNEEI